MAGVRLHPLLDALLSRTRPLKERLEMQYNLKKLEEIIGIVVLSIVTIFLCPSTSSANVTAETLAVIVNQADPLSVEIGEYYQEQRQIPEQNMIYVSFYPDREDLPLLEFAALKLQIDRATSSHIQAYALTWAEPYRVNCMSLTSAFALGYVGDFCRCNATPSNPYFNSRSSNPYRDHQIRPTMAIAALTFPEAQQLIDRGISSDGTSPDGTAYLMNTNNAARNVRSSHYPQLISSFSNQFSINIVNENHLIGRDDVMFYFTGIARVNSIETNTFLPGSVADHLTSFGGQVTRLDGQMSVLEWLRGGAVASYGTVEEPCNFLAKFPNPGVLMRHYLDGDAIIEAYWKSVQWPSQGIFVGEPLARPFTR